jgi:hypothetical protein
LLTYARHSSPVQFRQRAYRPAIPPVKHKSIAMNLQSLTTDQLVALRVETNRRIKQDRAAWSTIPLMAQKPWARAWQTCQRSDLTRRINTALRVLAEIARKIGPAPEFWKPRPASRADAKIRKTLPPLH